MLCGSHFTTDMFGVESGNSRKFPTLLMKPYGFAVTGGVVLSCEPKESQGHFEPLI